MKDELVIKCSSLSDLWCTSTFSIMAMIDGEDKVGLGEGGGEQDCSQIVSCSCQTKQSHSKLNIHNSPVQNYPSRPHTTFHIVT